MSKTNIPSPFINEEKGSKRLRALPSVMQLVSKESDSNSGKSPNSWPFLLGCQSFQIKTYNISKENIVSKKKKRIEHMEILQGKLLKC